jgi:hypothetical protein
MQLTAEAVRSWRLRDRAEDLIEERLVSCPAGAGVHPCAPAKKVLFPEEEG